MIAYISGKMTGLPDFNRLAFNEATRALRDAGHTVFNPADLTIVNGTWEDYMKQDLIMMLQSEIVFTLDGWRESQGALLEVAIANKMKIPVLDYSIWLKIRHHLRAGA